MENREKIQMAEDQGEIVGASLCSHDGRTGCFYHVCVKEEYRKHGIGNRFWQSMGWTFRNDLNYYDLVLNEENITTFQ